MGAKYLIAANVVTMKILVLHITDYRQQPGKENRMLKKIVEKVKLLPAIPKENEKLCDTCGGISWLIDKEKGRIERCPVCYCGIIKLCPYCGNPVRGVCSNSHCATQREAEAERKRYEKAIKADCSSVPAEYMEMMYSECYSYNEGYFTDIVDLIEDC